MANLKSSKKDVRRILKRSVANDAQKSKVRTYLKKAKVAVQNAKTYQEAMSAIVDYEKSAMISTKKDLFSKKAIARKVSALVLSLKSKFKEDEQNLSKKNETKRVAKASKKTVDVESKSAAKKTATV